MDEYDFACAQEENLRAFRTASPYLLPQHEGEYAIVRAGEKILCRDTWRDALVDGYERYGLKPFVVCKIQRFTPPASFSRDVVPVQR